MTRTRQELLRLSAWLSKLTSALCFVIIYVMLGLLALQVVMRYVFGSPPSWSEEVAITLFAWLVMLYATVGIREKFHVAVDFLPEGASRLRDISDRLVAFLMIGFGGILFWAGLEYMQRTTGQRTAALQLPIETLFAAVPVGGALLILHAFALLLAPKTERFS
jgi:TRAP-type C4-dicarboxylate transport system permease small subunit